MYHSMTPISTPSPISAYSTYRTLKKASNLIKNWPSWGPKSSRKKTVLKFCSSSERLKDILRQTSQELLAETRSMRFWPNKAPYCSAKKVTKWLYRPQTSENWNSSLTTPIPPIMTISQYLPYSQESTTWNPHEKSPKTLSYSVHRKKDRKYLKISKNWRIWTKDKPKTYWLNYNNT